MLSSIRAEIAKDILKTIPEHSFDFDCDAVYEVLKNHPQGLTPFQIKEILKTKLALVVQTLMALERSNRVGRMPDARWYAISDSNKSGENDP